MAVAAVQVLFVSFGAIQTALLSRALKFRSLLVVGLCSTLASGAVALTLALVGYGVWALALQQLVGAAATATGLWLASRWRPSRVFDFAATRPLFRFGSHVVVSGVLDVLYVQGFALLIGKMHGVASVGLYARAQNTQALPVGIIATMIGRVTLPLLATRVDDPEGLRRAVARATQLAMAISLPMTLGLASLAETAVLLLYGPAWAPAGPILCILAIAACLYPQAIILQHGILAQDKSQQYLNLIMAKQALALATMIVGSFFGIMGLAYSQLLNGLGGTILNCLAARRHISYGLRDQARDLGGIAALSVTMALTIAWLSATLDYPPLVEAALLIPGGALLYLLLALLFRVRAVLDALQLVASMLPGTARLAATRAGRD
jgi:O-antigen/teichoic acid export membrane protein